MIQNKAHRAVAIWIGIGIFMLIIQVLLGGITRLTGSGLSITEWDLLAIPPLQESQWQQEFQKYKSSPQYNLLNTHFDLSDFKFIYFWEWLHRSWAKLLGVVFLVGFIYLIVKKYLDRNMQKPLLILFLLGALQAVVGWIMVLSGLSGDAVYVKPTRLALHFVFALGLIAYAHWFFLKLTLPEGERKPVRKISNATYIMLFLLFVQLIAGALMAGNKAATAAPTWPDINGEMIPAVVGSAGSIKEIIENKITVQFYHRTLGYILFIGLIGYTFLLYTYRDRMHLLKRLYVLPVVLGVMQVFLGILSLVTSPRIVPNGWGVFETLALCHQLTAILLLISLVTILFLVRGNSYPRSS